MEMPQVDLKEAILQLGFLFLDDFNLLHTDTKLTSTLQEPRCMVLAQTSPSVGEDQEFRNKPGDPQSTPF